MTHVLRSFVVLFFLAGPALGAEARLVVGTVVEVTSYPQTDPRCPPKCPGEDELKASGEICISLSCGCAEARVEVSEVVWGTPLGDERIVVIRHRLSEFCHSSFPLDGESALFYSAGIDNSGWATIVEDNEGRLAFRLDEMPVDLGPEIGRLRDGNGLVPLDGIVHRK